MRNRCPYLSLIVVLCATAFAAGAQVENPTFKTWTACRPGTSIVLRDTRQVGGAQRKTEIKYTLLSVAADSVDVNVEMTMEHDGKSMTMPGRKQTITRMVESKEDSSKGLKEIEQAPTESVTVPAGTFKAKVWEHVISTDPVMGIKSKIWLSFDVPGGNVKTEMYRGKPGEEKLMSTIELVSIDKK